MVDTDKPKGQEDADGLSSSASRPTNAICLDGGGYLGLATASFIAEMERHFGTRTSDKFDLFCGTSTGGIIALGLAAGMSGDAIEALYRRLGLEVFSNKVPGQRWLRSVRGLVSSRYSNKALRRALADTFGEMTLADVQARGKSVAVPAFSLSTGTPRVFKTDHSPNLSLDSRYLLRDVALATSAAPIYLPIASLKSPTSGAFEQFVDGGIYANNPTIVAITEAITYLGCRPSDLNLLSLSTPRDSRSLAEKSRPLSRGERFRLQRGLLGWGSRLADLFIGSSMQLTQSAVTRMMVTIPGVIGTYARVDLPTLAGLALDIATPTATETLINIGRSAAAASDVRVKISPFMSM